MDALDPREQVALLKEELAKKEALIELAALKAQLQEKDSVLAAIEQSGTNSAGSVVSVVLVVIASSSNQRNPPIIIRLVRVGALSFRSLVEALDDPCQIAHINRRLQLAVALREHLAQRFENSWVKWDRRAD